MDFLNPEYYDAKTIHPDAPKKALLIELFELMNEQNERLWMFFEDIDEDPGHVKMKPSFIKPRQHRRSVRKAKKPRAIATVASEEFEAGYKNFLKEEFTQS